LSRLSLAVFIVVSFVAGYIVADKKIIAVSGTGLVYNQNQPPPDWLNSDVNFQQFWDVWKLINSQHVDGPIKDTKLFYGALAGLVSGVGDPYTVFLDPQTSQEFDAELSGSFEGIGAEIGLRDGRLVVIAPLDGTPAAKAGIKAGDIILTIDGQDTSGLSVEGAVLKIRGHKGTTVTLELLHAEANKPYTVTVTRAKIVVTSAKYKILKSADGQAIAHVQVTNFNEDSASQFRAVIDKVLPLNPDGIILDLRNNPGGFLDIGVEIASYWIKEQVVVVEQGDSRIEHKASGPSPLAGIKTVVLVNNGSASASEIVAGALQDYKLATVAGVKTFGKGSVQALRPLPDGSSIKITVAKWLTPLGRSIDQQGIQPDVEIVEPEEFKPEDDPQLKQALELFKK
jgi:carboxyl-terminal processing protease